MRLSSEDRRAGPYFVQAMERPTLLWLLSWEMKVSIWKGITYPVSVRRTRDGKTGHLWEIQVAEVKKLESIQNQPLYQDKNGYTHRLEVS